MVQGLANGQKYPASTVYPFTGLQAEQLYRQEEPSPKITFCML